MEHIPNIDALLAQVAKLNPDANLEKIRQAFEFAKTAHEGTFRKSGEPYINHPYSIAQMMVLRGYADVDMLCAVFLHDVVEDTPHTIEQLRQTFGDFVANIVDGLTKLTEIQTGHADYKSQNLRKILLAAIKDARVLIIKLFDRLDNLQSLDVFHTEKQQRIANETLNVYVPIADKIGLYEIKAELEDLAFRFVNPTMYDYIRENVHATNKEREMNSMQLVDHVKSILDSHHITCTVTGRAKHFYSIYKKMKEHNKTFSQILDLYGLRIIVETQKECYIVHRIIVSECNAMPGRFKDFIKYPAPNGYQSLHDGMTIKNKIVELQIRTKQMDYQAQAGIATHWKYKKLDRDKQFEKKLSWLKQLIRWKQTARAHDTHLDIFKDEIIVISPKGDPIILKDKSTPIDFAYAIHSDVGNHTRGAVVNGKKMPLTTQLTSGDIVYIETQKSPNVSRGWLSIAQMNSTQAKIRKALGIEVEHTHKKPVIDNVYNSLQHFKEITKKKIKISKCCNPIETDAIVAFYTKDKKTISVHKIDCPHQHALDPANRVVLTPEKKARTSIIDVLIAEQEGSLVNVLNTLLEQHVSILSIVSKENKQQLLLSIQINKTPKTAEKLIELIREKEGVIDAKVEA